MNFLRPKEEITLLVVPKPLHDDLIIRLPLRTGLSPGEMADLRIEDVDFEYNVLWVWRSKISRDHPVLADTETMFKLYEYVDKRKTGPLLLLDGSRRMKVQAMRRIVKHWAREAGLARWGRITPYTLRHTFCINWILGRGRGKGSLEGLRRQTGHRSLQKIKDYLDFDYDQVQAEYARIFEDCRQLTRHSWTQPQQIPYVV